MRLMTHVVAGYPSAEECLELIVGMDKLGVGLIEVQIPFSDPIADGETIMRANDVALENGMNINGSFRLIKQASAKVSAKIYIMSYVQKIIHVGIEEFCKRANDAGVKGLIVPDLPFDSPEYEILHAAAKKNSLEIIPVVSPGMELSRLKKDLAERSSLVYVTSTKGITGNKLNVTGELGRLCKDVRDISPHAKVAVGFGIQSKQDVKNVLKIADIAVVGSSVIREINKSGVSGTLKFISALTY